MANMHSKRFSQGVCRGLQEINVALGGTMRSLPKASDGDGLLSHGFPEGPPDVAYGESHTIRLAPDGQLAALLGSSATAVGVNSCHNQARPNASWSLLRTLLTLSINPGSLYRCGKSD